MLTKMLDYLRFALYAVLIAILMFGYQIWEKEHPPKTVVQTLPQTTTANNYVPQVSTVEKSASMTSSSAPQVAMTTATQHIVHVTTDVVDVDIDLQGGNITQVKLLKYPEVLHSTIPFVLLNNTPGTRYIAQSGLLSAIGPDTTKGQALYSAEKSSYSLDKNQNELLVKLQWIGNDGLKVFKIFRFTRDNYEIGVTYQIDNLSQQAWNGNLYMQLLRTNAPPKNGQGFSSLTTYFGAAVSSPDKLFEKISFKDMTKENLNRAITSGWAAMIQHYFVSAWVPDRNATYQYFTRITNDDLFTVGMISPNIVVTPGASITTSSKFYAGPAIADRLEKVAPGLQLTIDYGIFWIISVPIFWLMQKIYNIVANWGWAIVLVTVIIKILFYPLSAKSYRSMSGLKKIQPKINALKERFGEDKQKFTQATIELYKKEKVNPMSGCLPILVQIPVFIALYWVLIESVQLRQAPFILWIHDLSVKDPYYVLPILMGLSMLLQQKLSPPPPDPMQAKLMLFMPVIFTVLFINFPAGLMLYWFVNNTLSVLQQWFIMRNLEKAEKSKKKT